MSKKPKPSKNKAADVETKQKVEKLWAQYGKLQAQREQQTAALQRTVEQMRQISLQIQKNAKDK